MTTSPLSVSLRTGSGTLLHRQLFVVLRERILRGDVPADAALPKEQDLCEEFGVSRITVRRALADLENEGLVQRRHGKGTYVLRRDAPDAPAPSLGLLDSLRRTAAETDVQVLDVRTMVPSAAIATQLQLSEGERAVRAIRLRSSGDTPLLLTEAWVPERLGKKVTAAKLKKRALYELLLDQGVHFGRVAQEITAEAADPSRAAVLQTGVSAPLLRLSRLIHDTESRPILHLTGWMSPERSRILMDIPGDAINTLSGGHMVHAPQVLRAARRRAA
jgi:GntR family transcriptional regulator